MGLQLQSKFVPMCRCFTREGNESAQATCLLNELRILFLELDKSALSVCASHRGQLLESVFFDKLVLDKSELGAHRVAIEGAEVSVGYLWLSFMSMVEATGEHFLRKGYEIRGGIQVPVLVGPELARAANSSLNFVDNHVESKFFGQCAQALGEFI